MKRVAIGKQSFEDIRKKDCFYVDKTAFIKEWWEMEDDVTLITRPRRFGKTLNMDMLNCFFQTNIKTEVICLKVLTYGRRKTIEGCREHIR